MSNDFYVGYYEDHYIAHHGILGQKWGIRRYQNPDGSLTDAGYKRYGKKHLDAGMRQDIRKKKQIDSKHTAAATGVAGIGGATLALATGGSLPLSLLATAGTTAAVSSVLHRISTAKLKSNYAEMIAERKKGEDKIQKMLESNVELQKVMNKHSKEYANLLAATHEDDDIGTKKEHDRIASIHKKMASAVDKNGNITDEQRAQLLWLAGNKMLQDGSAGREEELAAEYEKHRYVKDKKRNTKKG